jgi:hypothetical protein
MIRGCLETRKARLVTFHLSPAQVVRRQLSFSDAGLILPTCDIPIDSADLPELFVEGNKSFLNRKEFVNVVFGILKVTWSTLTLAIEMYPVVVASAALYTSASVRKLE